MKTLPQIIAVTSLNLRAIAQRRGNSLVIVLGTAGVVAVMVAVLSMTSGFLRTMSAGGEQDRVVLQTRGAYSEGMSSLSRENVKSIELAPGIRKGADGKALVSAELVTLMPVIRKSDGEDAFVNLRGIEPQGFALRPELRLIAGRLPRSGVREVVVGAAAQKQFAGLEPGDEVRSGDGDWTVVGVFQSGGSAYESTLIADAEAMLSAYRLTTFNTVIVRLASADSFDVFRDAITAIPGLTVDVQREPDYLAAASEPFRKLLNLVACALGGIMAVGALFGALNTMYSAVSMRSAEIATLRAIGFGGSAVVTSVFVEALLLALLGAAIGVLLVYVGFDGRTISTVGNYIGNSPQIVYSLSISPHLALIGILFACGVGLLGGLFPAVRAARLPVAAALRAK
ncbi:MAG: ABC transporter permease [Gammaproteobacteria bacterium]